MKIEILAYHRNDINEAVEIWNQIISEGNSFPQTDPLTPETGHAFFAGQSYAGIARDTETSSIQGLYILHPNNIGRCGHICNASYAVNRSFRGRGIGEALVKDCMEQAKRLGFRILQFNAVVKSNTAALRLYERLGFTQLGVIPGGFRLDDGSFEDIIPHYILLTSE
jgi:GNAT superfamily N-acetyltransferase